jgi:integrase
VLDDHRKTAGGNQFLFPQEREAYLENASNLTKEIQKFFESCGLKTNEKSDSVHRKRAIVRVGFHSLRHSFVSLCAKAGAPQHVVQKLVGHGSPAMTEHYTHLDSEQKQKAIANLPDIGKAK